MCNSDWVELFPSCRSQYLNFEGSDHRPLLSFLDTKKKRGKRIFRYDRRLRDNTKVKKIIEEVWETYTHLCVEARLNLCRKAICKWSKEHQINSRKAIENLKDELETAMINPSPDEAYLHEINAKLLQAYKAEEEFWRQRSRQVWLTLGDSNTEYFHAMSKGRKAKNRLSVLENDEGEPTFEEDQIAELICQYYEQLFTANQWMDSSLISSVLEPQISSKCNENLMKDPTPLEIKEALFAIHPDKAPGPDGFSASFFQSHWEVVGSSVVLEVQRFFSTGVLPPTLNHTHIRLIPKTSDAKKVADYRPIALCNVLYKIISKLLSLRLKTVLDSIISENQSAFIPGRAITDNVLITHEMLHYLKTSQAQINCSMAVKMDMSKAYDRVEWVFVSEVLQRLGFHDKWINLIMQCIQSVSYSFLINDTVYGLVKPYRGIRQGDPLSPYIFILCGEVLSGLCRKAGREGSLKGIRVARGSPRINHLLFADDTMMFCHSTPENCHALSKLLQDYEALSGQKVNTAKSAITFSSKTPQEVKTAAKSILGITREGGMGKYLGLPEHFGRKKKDLFTSIVDRIRQCASNWSSRFLSKAGKLTMLQSVLTAIPSYTMSCFEIPLSLCKRIQSALTRFWWDSSSEKRSMCWVSWDNLATPKAMGGLGLRDIQIFNQALLAKLAWRILSVPDCLLARVLKGKYCHQGSFLTVELPSACSHGWRGIVHGRNLLRDNIGKAIGNGQNTSVWKESWISLDSNLKPFGPINEHNLDLRVSDLLTSDLQWNKQRIGEVLPELSEQIQALKPSKTGAEDIYIWQPLPSGIYSTKSGYNLAANTPRHAHPIAVMGEFNWIKEVWSAKCSPKLRVFMWSIIKGAIPLGENLQRRGLLTNVNCTRCGEVETPMHIFFNCAFAQEVWQRVPLTTRPSIEANDNFQSMLVKFRQVSCLPPSGISSPVLPWICWSLWTARNKLIFEDKTLNPKEAMLRGLVSAREWIQAQGTITQKSRALPQGTRLRGEAGTDNSSTCNSDASWNVTTRRAGLAWIIATPTSTQTHDGSLCTENVKSPLMAEALALQSGLLAVASLDITSIRVYSDCQTLIRAIQNKLQIKEIFGIVSDIMQISSAFESISFSFVPRSENQKADCLAKRALISSVSALV